SRAMEGNMRSRCSEFGGSAVRAAAVSGGTDADDERRRRGRPARKLGPPPSARRRRTPHRRRTLMAQDTRKDPRAKGLSMTVRYKSATVDEFIEHHANDVSRGGIFIKTPSPFPPGTLLKFEIRLQDEQTMLSGVGRVVWKRDPPDAGDQRPAGMGVKFIKIDDK